MSPKLRPVLAYLDALEERADLAILGALLEAAHLTVEDVEEHLRFQDDRYARSKVASGPWYDLFVMGWKPGQSSCIHDHAGSSCALRILQGRATEIGFVPVAPGGEVVRMERLRTYDEGSQCLAQDADVHQIANRCSTQNLVTVHVYSPPLRMSVYRQEPEAFAVAA